MTSHYCAQATAIGGRTGSAASADGALRVLLDTPRELGGEGGKGTNPEQLLAAAYAASFLETLRTVALGRRLQFAPDANVTATIGIAARDEAGRMTLAIRLDVDLPGMDEDAASALTAEAHSVCAYSNAMSGNIEIRIDVQ